jgi:superfamily II DNA or RNA helicase
MSSSTYRVPEDSAPRPPLGLLKESQEFGFRELELVEPPARFLIERPSGSPLRTGLDAERVQRDPSPVEQLGRLPRDAAGTDDSPSSLSRRSLARLFAWFLLAEDPQRRLDARAVSTLAHQVSVVRHILSEAHLRSVMLADEVGLGKTVEAGLLIQELREKNAALRVLYLAPAGLVDNVHGELARLGLPFRRWIAGSEGDARLTDPLVLASIHRAVHPQHYETFLQGQRWDVVVIDECHHLSDWQKGGGKPTRKYRLAEALRQQQGAAGRLLLMSGTPHQGHPDRFENLLRLLRRGDEARSALAGRVIYRTKDDIYDWDGQPLFPRRQVYPPLVVDLGDDYKKWLASVHRAFELNGDEQDDLGAARRRALGWRCGQALQWATSSIHAGLGFLVRQALRAGWTLDHAPLAEAIAGLRPHRHGAVDEPVEHLYQRLRADLSCRSGGGEDLEGSEEDAEAGDDARWRPEPGALEGVLRDGLRLLSTHADVKWERIRTQVLDHHHGDKVVLFAQPVETVMALASYLQCIDGQRPAMIIGGQTAEERMLQVEAFRRVDGPRFLVSSKAGGEGLNLQVAHVLVHVDVPWNPMDLEQRVGRVHRFLSQRTIQVHTIVVKDSREVHVYDAARRKLRDVAHTMAPDRFEELFSRVMALVPPEELTDVLVRDAGAPLDATDLEELGQIVTAGYQRWEQFHREFARSHLQIDAVTAGQARWDDVALFAKDHLGAYHVDGVGQPRLARTEDGEIVQDPREAEGVVIDGEIYGCGDFGANPPLDIRGKRVLQLGLNVPVVLAALQRIGLTEELAGAFHVSLSNQLALFEGKPAPMGALFYARSILSLENGSCREIGLDLRAFLVAASGSVVALEGEHLGELIRKLMAAPVRRESSVPQALWTALRDASARLEPELRRPPERDRRHVLFPLAAGILEPTPGRG